MLVTQIKQGSTGLAVIRQLLREFVPFDLANLLILTSGRDKTGGEPLYFERDITAFTAIYGLSGLGVVAYPIYTGYAMPSDEFEIALGADDGVLLTAPYGPAGTTKQVLYATKANLGVYYKVAEWSDGASVDRPIAGLSNAEMTTFNPSFSDQSKTNRTAGLPQATITSVSVDTGNGRFSAGSHSFVLANVGTADTVDPRTILFETIIRNRATGEEFTFPQSGFEELHVLPNIRATP